MRILWVACAQPGSLYPALPIALELARRGHELTVLCDPVSQPTFVSLGFAFRPATELDQALTSFDASAHGGGRAAKLAWHAAYVRGLHADTLRALADRFDLAMIDPLEPGAAFAVEGAGVPWFAYVHWRMDELGADVPFRFHFWDGASDADSAFAAWWNEQRELVDLPPERRPPAEGRWYRNSPHLTMLLGLPELVHPRGMLPAYARRVGPTSWLPPLDAPLPPWIDELGDRRPAVLASVSTTGAADRALLGAVAEAVVGLDVDVVATVAADGELPPLPPNVRLAPFVPHAALLPRVAAVVSHGGNGTVTHAACAGVPLVLLPEGRDQFEVARGAVAAGIAIELRRDSVDAATVRSAVRAVLAEPEFGERARAIAERATQYDAPAAAADAVEALGR
jgi:UDP:flavonoid glycosyltransferase YjiC (YdhE family)